MTDWERVARLRAKGADWDQVAADRRVAFEPPQGADPGRALRTLWFERRSKTGGLRKSSEIGRDERGAGWRDAGRLPPTRLLVTAGVVAVVVSLALYFALFGHPLPNPNAPSNDPGPGAAGTMVEFTYLSTAMSGQCVNMGDETANMNFIMSVGDNSYLQGSCCSAMDFQDYSNQVTNLTSYSSISLIAPDPYDQPGHIVKADIAGLNLALTPSQQATYDNSMPLTKDKAPCCCMCWAGYVHQGLANQLIVHYGYDSQQVAAVLNLEDCCGGPGPSMMG